MLCDESNLINVANEYWRESDSRQRRHRWRDGRDGRGVEVLIHRDVSVVDCDDAGQGDLKTILPTISKLL